MASDESKPVLWVACTSAGRKRTSMEGDVRPDEESLGQLKEELDEQLGDRYEVVVADDKVRLLDAEEVRELIQDLQEYAAQFAHEDALFEEAQEGGDGE